MDNKDVTANHTVGNEIALSCAQPAGRVNEPCTDYVCFLLCGAIRTAATQHYLNTKLTAWAGAHDARELDSVALMQIDSIEIDVNRDQVEVDL